MRNGVSQLVPDTCCADTHPMLHAVSALCPASPLSSQISDAATVCSSSVTSTLGIPYHLCNISEVQASVLSKWQTLQAFGRLFSWVGDTPGLVIVWLRIAFSSP